MSFQLLFLYVQPVFILVNVLNKHIMVSENIPPQRREVVVDEIGDEKQKEIPRKKSEGF